MIKKTICAFCLYFSGQIFSADVYDKVVAYYQIQDYESALNLIERQSKQEPYRNLKLEILAKLGLTQNALDELRYFPEIYDLKKKENFLNLESLAWSILSNQKNNAESVQVASLIGAYLTRDAKAALLLKKHLFSSNSKLRAMAANFSSYYQDPFLKTAVFQRLKDEKNVDVKKELIAAIGKMKMKEAQPMLEEILLSEFSSDDLKATALFAYAEIFDEITQNQIQFFLRSPRAHFKQLGLRLLFSFENLPEEVFPEIISLLKDSTPEVKQEALVTIALLQNEVQIPKEIFDEVENLTTDKHQITQLLAFWCKARSENKLDPKFKDFLDHPNEQARLLSVALLGCIGKSGEPILHAALDHKDSYVSLNAAYALLHRGKGDEKILNVLDAALKNPKHFLMIDQSINPQFSYISPSKVRHHPFIMAYPKVMDGMARIRLLEAMSTYDNTRVKNHLKNLLSQKEAVLTFYTIGLLLQEDLESLTELKELTKDPNPSIALAATLSIAFVGKDPNIAPKLAVIFEHVGFEEKLHILEAIGALGNKEMVPFLVKMLQKPFSSLQIVAASALIQCLYH